MKFFILTLFPELFDSFLGASLIGKALEKGVFEIQVVDIRAFSTDRHKSVDDRPFGGGPGMVLKPGPIVRAVESCALSGPDSSGKTMLLTPTGTPLTQTKLRELAQLSRLVLVCGRYEGVDARIMSVIDEELSIGDYVLSGGEVPAMVVIEAVTRLLPGVVGKFESTEEDTFSEGLLEYPQYTRPRDFRGQKVPDVLVSGDHAAIRAWRLEQSLERTALRRPDLLDRADLSAEARAILNRLSEKRSTTASESS